MSNNKLNKIDFLLPEEVHRRALKSISAQKIIDSINQERHLPGKHNQKTHGGGGGRISSKLTQSVLEKVKANGGLSVNMLSGNEPTGGYMVAKGTNLGDIVSADDFYDETKISGILSNYFKKNKSELSGSDNYLGIWHNTEDGQVYLDVSQNILDRTEAIVAGQTRDQISIWDVVNFEEIGTGGTGDIRTNRHSEDSGHFRNDGSGDRSTINADSKTDLSRKREAAEKIIRHLPGKHSQKSHGGGRKGKSNLPPGMYEEVRRPYVKHDPQPGLPDPAWIEQNNELLEREALAQSYEKFGYNDKPSVSSAEFEELKKDGAVVVYRGFEPSDRKPTEEMTAEFRNGDKHFVGGGYYGNGTYVSKSRDTAIGYSMLESEPGGKVMSMAIRPEAKFIHESNITSYLYGYGKEVGYESAAFDFLQKDASQAAIFLGFDGIVRQHNESETHYIILNRSAVVVPQYNELL
jgi:hypothetical protein